MASAVRSPRAHVEPGMRNARAHTCIYGCVRACAVHDTYRLDLGQFVGLGTGEQQMVRTHSREKYTLCCHAHRRRVDEIGLGGKWVVADAHGERREALAAHARTHNIKQRVQKLLSVQWSRVLAEEVK